MKLAYLYTQSELTPWKENVNINIQGKHEKKMEEMFRSSQRVISLCKQIGCNEAE
jgi:hypothetical protein